MTNEHDYPHGLLFSDDLQKQVKNRFCNVDSDPEAGERLFFENAGGSLRLKAVNEAYQLADSFPDCDSRKHKRAKSLRAQTLDGFADIRIMFNAPKYAQILNETSSSKAMFTIVRTILENVPGTNVVTTELEHPSVFDSVRYYAKKMGMEFRVCPPNKKTGGIDPETLASYVDENTALVNCIYASNHTGVVMDIEKIVALCRAKKPDVYIVSDAVQHMPHGLVDVQKVELDAVNFAAYKIFGCRGFGAAYISDRLARLDHPAIIGNLGDPWEIGGPAPAMLATATAIVDYVCWLGSQFSKETDRRKLWEEGMTRIELQERALLHHTLKGTKEVPGLRNIPNATVHFDRDDFHNRDFIMALTFKNINYTDAVVEYQKRGVIVYDRNDTNYYSVRSLHPFDLDGIIRVSPLHCHSTADVEKFLKVSAEIAAL